MIAMTGGDRIFWDDLTEAERRDLEDFFDMIYGDEIEHDYLSATAPKNTTKEIK